MVNPTNPFAAFDPRTLFDMEKLAADLKRSGLGAVDMGALMDAQRRNVEALVAANTVAAEGMRALAQRQAEILRQTIEHAGAAMRDLMQAGGPEDKAARQTEIAKAAFERAIANARELAELTAKAQHEASDVIARRMAASMDELKTLIDSAQKR